MLKSGLVSVSFRKLSFDEIIKEVAASGLKAIEWGGDVHVPHGDIEKAKEVHKKCKDEGLDIAAYGSYYKAGESESSIPFESVLATAVTLHAPTIRVWAGNKDSKDADEKYRLSVADDLKRIGDLAINAGISISLEYHVHTLTDTLDSALRLIKEVGHDNVLNYWQPPVNITHEECKAGLKSILPKLTNIHVYHWAYENNDYIRFALAEGKERWREYFQIVKSANHTGYALLEFIKDDSLEQLRQDAKTLNQLLEGN